MGEELSQGIWARRAEREKQEQKERRQGREALPSLSPADIKVGVTYHNGGVRKRKVLGFDGVYVRYSMQSRKGGVFGEPLGSFAKWAKGVVE